MSFAEIVSVIAVCLSAIALFNVIYSVGAKMATLQVKVDTMWEFMLRRGKSEAVQLGYASLNSPLIVFEETKRRMEVIMPVLRELYKRLTSTVSDVDLAIAIEHEHGSEMLKNVCVPCGMYLGACLVIAIQILRDEDKDGGGGSL